MRTYVRLRLRMQLAFDSADRLVELLEERRGSVSAEEAARRLFAAPHVPAGPARSLLEDVVGGRTPRPARRVGLAYVPGRRGRAPRGSPVRRRRSRDDRPVAGEGRDLRDRRRPHPGTRGRAEFQTLVNPRRPLPAPVAALTGLADPPLRRAPPAAPAVRRFLTFAGMVLVAHNARFDLGFLDREVELLTGRRSAAPVVDTVWLARRVLEGGIARVGLGSLAWFFGTSVDPCHRALPDAQATAEILLALVGLAQERGEDGRRPPAAGRAAGAAPGGQAHVAAGAPQRPGVYLFRDAHDRVLYIGRARDLRARLRSYFRTERQRPALEAALGALERIEWRPLGSELEAALEELRLCASSGRRRTPAARGRPHVYLRRRGIRSSSGRSPRPGGRSGRGGARSSRRGALRDADDAELAGLASGASLRGCAASWREWRPTSASEDAARLRDRISALERVVSEIATLERLRASELASSSPRSKRATGARTSSAAGASQRCACCRPGRAHASSWPQASPRRSAQRRRSPQRTQTSSSSSARSSAARRPSSRSCCSRRPSAARPDPRRAGLRRHARRDLSLQGLSLGGKLCRFVHRRLRRARDDGAARADVTRPRRPRPNRKGLSLGVESSCRFVHRRRPRRRRAASGPAA